jgi:hypothetical protein
MTRKLSVAALVILAVTMLFGKAEAKTKSNPVVELDIPFAFQMGHRTLPAGSYKFELATGAPANADTMSVLVVRNREAGIYHAIAVPVKVAAGLSTESRAVFGGGDQHVLVAVWQGGNRLDVQLASLTAAENSDDWSNGTELVSVAFRPERQ